ncbi:hypothetical protein B6N60_03234 [Richelia sinica FACHB-800]|uniref:Uncharacterized protein n=1 Tax=Richelia sinica FACHB-800 TaxID=1357546 RepID=A0A975T9E8_9NOST|nr:hypothetical protein B6N60_03234 [Richelia sinica FACHB-800]
MWKPTHAILGASVITDFLQSLHLPLQFNKKCERSLGL